MIRGYGSLKEAELDAPARRCDKTHDDDYLHRIYFDPKHLPASFKSANSVTHEWTRVVRQ